MITGSHNPPEYNGFKVSVGTATLHGPEIQVLREIADSEDFEVGRGTVEQEQVLERYVEEISSSFGVLQGKPHVVVDCGNGTAALAATRIYRNLGCRVDPLFCEVDGNFPNHHPDPTVEEFLQDLIREVRERKADLGLAFDGDSDRIGAVDDTGRIIWGDQLMILYSREILKEHPGATFIAEVKCSKNLYEDIQRHGGRAIMWKAGHSLIKAKLKEEKALLAGEMSGHMFFADRYYGFDDALYAGARLLEICSRSEQKLSQMLSDLPETFATPEIRVECPDSVKFEVVRQAQEEFSRSHETVTVDGVRIMFEDGWGLIRASNTQPALVLRFEAESPERLAQIRSLIEQKLDEIMNEAETGV